MSTRHASLAAASPAHHHHHHHHNQQPNTHNHHGSSTLNGSTSSPATTAPTRFGARALRSETRAKAKDDIKRVMNAIEKVRKWERRWISVNDTTLKLYKWVPVLGNADENLSQPQQQQQQHDHQHDSSSMDTNEAPQQNINSRNELTIASVNVTSTTSVLNMDENAQDSSGNADTVQPRKARQENPSGVVDGQAENSQSSVDSQSNVSASQKMTSETNANEVRKLSNMGDTSAMSTDAAHNEQSDDENTAQPDDNEENTNA